MKQIRLGGSDFLVPAIAVGCMRLSGLSQAEAEKFILGCVERGARFFDHADIYGGGQCEEMFGHVLKNNPALRDQIILQSKCGIRRGMYDLSREHILESVDGILRRLQTDRLDALLLHRPDALVEPDEVAEAFDRLEQSGKVLRFGVSNQNAAQMALLQASVRQKLLVNQLQLSVPAATMISSGMEVNMETPGAVDRDGGILDYCRLHQITIQAWSPFQKPGWAGTFLGDHENEKLFSVLNDLSEKYDASPSAIAAAWILRHPARIQLIAGTTSLPHLDDILKADTFTLTREEWYSLYLAAGHILP